MGLWVGFVICGHMCGFCNVYVCVCGFCKVWVCVCVGLVMFGFVGGFVMYGCVWVL